MDDSIQITSILFLVSIECFGDTSGASAGFSGRPKWVIWTPLVVRPRGDVVECVSCAHQKQAAMNQMYKLACADWKSGVVSAVIYVRSKSETNQWKAYVLEDGRPRATRFFLD